MPAAHTEATDPDALDELDIQRLQDLLDQVPEPLLPLDVSAVDGFLCGLLLQPNKVDASAWLPCITDVEARALPTGFEVEELRALVGHRYAHLQRAIAQRQWFDPWVFELEPQAAPSECVLPWVAGFAAAMERFPGLMRGGGPQLLEPLALIYMHFDAQDLEDADELQQKIDTLEPAADLGEAVQDIVRSVMLLADAAQAVIPAPLGKPRRSSGNSRR
jgi:uncharacterized protein